MNAYKQTVEEPSVIREEAERQPERGRRTLDPSSPEFTRMLVQTFVDARNEAIDLLEKENRARSLENGQR